MVLLLIATLLKYTLIAIPNLGFYVANRKSLESINVWYNPPEGQVAAHLQTLSRYKNDVQQLMKKRKKIVEKLEALKSKPRMSADDEEIVKGLDTAMLEVDSKLIESLRGQDIIKGSTVDSFRQYTEDLEWPRILWITIGANVAVGIALYSVWGKIGELMVLLLIAAVIRYSLIAIPNFGLFMANRELRKPLCVWYSPPEGELELSLRTLKQFKQDVNRLMKIRNKMITKLLQLSGKERSSEEAEVEDKMKSLDRAVSDLDHQLVEALQGQVAVTELTSEAFREYLKDLGWPNILWVTIGANVSAGMALYLIWRKIGKGDYVFAPTLALEVTMACHWSYYPCLFHIGSYKLSCLHSILSPLTAIMTTYLFWQVDRIAAVFLLPYLYSLGYVCVEMLSVGQEKADVRLLAVNKSRGNDY